MPILRKAPLVWVLLANFNLQLWVYDFHSSFWDKEDHWYPSYLCTCHLFIISRPNNVFNQNCLTFWKIFPKDLSMNICNKLKPILPNWLSTVYSWKKTFYLPILVNLSLFDQKLCYLLLMWDGLASQMGILNILFFFFQPPKSFLFSPCWIHVLFCYL